MNLFATAKQKVEKKPKNEKISVRIEKISNDLTRLAELQEKIDAMTAEAKLLSENVRSVGVETFVDLYDKNKKYPGSFNVEAGKASMMFIPVDRYIKIDHVRAQELIDKYGEDSVSEKTTYIMSTDLVDKYGEIISDLIIKSKKIAEEDKAKLISANTDFSVASGMIQRLEDYSTHKMEIIEDIKPIFQLKNVKVEE